MKYSRKIERLKRRIKLWEALDRNTKDKTKRPGSYKK